MNPLLQYIETLSHFVVVGSIISLVLLVARTVFEQIRNEMRYMAPDDEIDRYIEAKKTQFAKMTTLQLMRGVLTEWTKVDMTGPH